MVEVVVFAFLLCARSDATSIWYIAPSGLAFFIGAFSRGFAPRWGISPFQG